MKQHSQAGLSTLQIIIGLTIVAVLFAVISNFMGANDEQEMAGTAESTAEGNTPLETFAENRAADIAAPAIEAMADNEAELKAEMQKDEMAAGEMDDMMDEAEVVVPAPEPVAVAAAGTFTDYDESKLVAEGTNVLFFHADWCPSCRGLEDNINANLSSIPAGTSILKIDYDSETELKKDYGVVRQHTLIVVDGNGNEIKKLTGLTNTLDQVVSQL